MSVSVYDARAIFSAVSPEAAVAAVEDSFRRHAAGEWQMPSKLYLDASPHGDFRAMPASGGGLAILKWVTSFPHNPQRGLPVVDGALLVSELETGALVGILDCAAVTSLRTGAAAAVSARALAAPGAASAAVIGCGVNGAWAGRCLRAIGFREGVCADIRVENARRLASELGWRSGERADAAGQDVVVTVTPGDQPVVFESELRAGQHFAVLGADARGKSEVEPQAFRRMRLFCDEWAQASAGGELAGPVAAGIVGRNQVVQLGHVIAGTAEGRHGGDEITLFDSTGLATQDLAIALAVLGSGQEPTAEVDLSS